jgi:ribosomal protein S18 acetylase RimI-like enzyme
MRLTVVEEKPTFDPARVLASFSRAQVDFLSLGLEAQPIDLGTALVTPALDQIRDANCVLDARVPAGHNAESLWRNTHTHFRQRGSAMMKLVFSAGASDAERTPLVNVLQQNGWVEQRRNVLRLERSPGAAKDGPSVLSARAVRRLYETFARTVAAEINPQMADLAMLRLDEPQFEVLVALQGGTVVARAGVLSLGDMGLIENVVVHPAHRRRGLARRLMHGAIDLCARSQFRHVLLGCDASNVAAQTLYASLGFAKLGEYAEWREPTVV